MIGTIDAADQATALAFGKDFAIGLDLHDQVGLRLRHDWQQTKQQQHESAFHRDSLQQFACTSSAYTSGGQNPSPGVVHRIPGEAAPNSM